MADFLELKRVSLQTSMVAWAGDHLRDFPWRKKENSTPYGVLLAELLLKRTTATAANSVYVELFATYPNISDLINAQQNDLERWFKRVGLYKQRTHTTLQLGAYLKSHHNGGIPCHLSELSAAPGLGEYSARAILSFGFDQPYAVVDSNVKRIFDRLFSRLPKKKRRAMNYQKIADRLLPVEQHQLFNFGLLDLGSLVCRPIRPLCNHCPLNHSCDAGRNYSDRDIKTTNYSKLRSLRKLKGLSQVSLSQRSGVSKSSILDIEAGRRIPKIGTVRRLAETLQVSINEMF